MIRLNSAFFWVLIVLVSASSCQKPSNYPQSLFSETRVNELMELYSDGGYYPIGEVFPPPQGEEWLAAAWVQEYNAVLDQLKIALNNHFPDKDFMIYFPFIKNTYVDELQWALVLLPKKDPNNTTVIYFDKTSNVYPYPKLLLKNQFAVSTEKLAVKIDKVTDKSKVVVFSFFPEFQIYGLPEGQLEDNDSLTIPYGFVVRRLAGCEEETPNQFEKIDSHNQNTYELMVKRYGKDWLGIFERETGQKLLY